jgi:hypothetical protein
MDDGEAYKVGAAITWFLIFIPTWIWCIYSYGFLLGVGLGWLPSAIVATILCWLWPLYVLAIVGIIAVIFFNGK